VTYSRKLALATGIFFVITIIASIPAAFVFYAPVLEDPRYIVGAGADTHVFWGAFLEVLTALACIGTAVALFPIVKRQNEAVALGYVAVRIFEATIIAVGIVSLLAVVTLRQDLAGASGAVSLGQGLVAIHDATFLIGPGLLAGLGNGMLLGYLMYRSGLVPRRMAMLGLIGGPLVTASGIAVLFGLYEQVSPVAAIIAIPETLWELSLGIWLIVKGFDPSAAILSEPDRIVLNERDELSLSRA
jgi:Domain of unknown function (DUF4386)